MRLRQLLLPALFAGLGMISVAQGHGQSADGHWVSGDERARFCCYSKSWSSEKYNTDGYYWDWNYDRKHQPICTLHKNATRADNKKCEGKEVYHR